MNAARGRSKGRQLRRAAREPKQRAPMDDQRDSALEAAAHIAGKLKAARELIAEMLDALEEIAGSGLTDDGAEQARTVALAAIAKAKGAGK